MAGEFEILEVLGAGAYATVVVARPKEEPNRRVALKVLKVASLQDSGAQSRMRDEATMLRRLHHPSVIRVHRLLDYAGRPVIEMEVVEGASFEDLSRKFKGGMPPAVVLEVTAKVTSALDAAYNFSDGPGGKPMRIIHRDIKPSNVLLSSTGDVKVLDFGIAKAKFDGREAKSLYMVRGSMGFQAPERKDGMEDTAAVDVYAVGMLIWALLTGKALIVSNHADRHDAGVKKQLDALFIPDLPSLQVEGLKALMERMLRYEPKLRPPNAEVATTVMAILKGARLKRDLVAFAAEHVAPIVAARTREPARMHHAFSEVEFLETTEPTIHEEAKPLKPAQLDAQVRKFLATPGWETRVPDLQRLISRGKLPEKPLLEVLDRLKPAWWQFWVKQATIAEAAAVLLVLCDFPTPAVVARAKQLENHTNPSIASAAKFLVMASG